MKEHNFFPVMSYLQPPPHAGISKISKRKRGKTKKYSECVVGGCFQHWEERKGTISKNISSFHFSPLIPAFSRADVDGDDFTGAQHAAETLNPRRAPSPSFPGYGVFKHESRDLSERQRYPCITVATPPGNKEIRSSRRPVSRGKA